MPMLHALTRRHPDQQPLQTVLKEVDFDVAPVGSDVLANEDKNVFVARDVDASSLSVSDPD
ncbi:MAG: hypothetical protein ACI89Z_000645 [Porticoccus sp.]|jgi:hypothetical protein